MMHPVFDGTVMLNANKIAKRFMARPHPRNNRPPKLQLGIDDF
jgi:hypothetical protein